MAKMGPKMAKMRPKMAEMAKMEPRWPRRGQSSSTNTPHQRRHVYACMHGGVFAAVFHRLRMSFGSAAEAGPPKFAVPDEVGVLGVILAMANVQTLCQTLSREGYPP